jgi:hypothetical protein
MGSSSKTTARIIGQTQPSLRETAITHLGGLLAIDAKPLATLADFRSRFARFVPPPDSLIRFERKGEDHRCTDCHCNTRGNRPS